MKPYHYHDVDPAQTCEKCGVKRVYKVGSKTSYSTHCWNCGYETHTEVVDF